MPANPFNTRRRLPLPSHLPPLLLPQSLQRLNRSPSLPWLAWPALAGLPPFLNSFLNPSLLFSFHQTINSSTQALIQQHQYSSGNAISFICIIDIADHCHHSIQQLAVFSDHQAFSGTLDSPSNPSNADIRRAHPSATHLLPLQPTVKMKGLMVRSQSDACSSHPHPIVIFAFSNTIVSIFLPLHHLSTTSLHRLAPFHHLLSSYITLPSTHTNLALFHQT